MILAFKNQFPDKIIDGIKIHTIREDPGARWKPGRKIHMATGVRTKNYFCFMEDTCRSVQTIYIFYFKNGETKILIDGKVKYQRIGAFVNLGEAFIKKLAKNDGFDSVEDFFKWFNQDFQGRIIHWTDFKY